MGNFNSGPLFQNNRKDWTPYTIIITRNAKQNSDTKSTKEIKGKKRQTGDHLLKPTASEWNIFTSNTKSNEKVLTRLHWNISRENPLEIHLQSVRYQISTVNMAIKKVKSPEVVL